MKKISLILVISILVLCGCQKSNKVKFTAKEFPNQLTDFVYSDIHKGENGYLLATKKGKTIALDMNGKEYTDQKTSKLAECKYHLGTFDGISYYGDRRNFIASKIIVDQDGNLLSKPKIPDGWKIVNEEDYINQDEVVPAIYLKTSEVLKKAGYINKNTGEVVIEAQFEEAGQFENGIARVIYPSDGPSKRIAYINEQGEEINPMVTGTYTKELSDEDFWGQSYSEPAFDYSVVNYQNGIIPQIEQLGKFYSNDGILGINERTKKRYVFKDVDGNVVNPTMFTYTTGFIDGSAYIKIPEETNWCVMELNGNIIKTELDMSKWLYATYDKELGCYFLQESFDDTEGTYADHTGKILSQSEIEKMSLYKHLLDKNSGNMIVQFKNYDVDKLISIFGVTELEKIIENNQITFQDDSCSILDANTYYYMNNSIEKDFKITLDEATSKNFRITNADSTYLYTDQSGIYDWSGKKVSEYTEDTTYLFNGRKYVNVTDGYALGFMDKNGDYTAYACEDAMNLGDGLFIVSRKDKDKKEGGREQEYKYALISLK